MSKIIVTPMGFVGYHRFTAKAVKAVSRRQYKIIQQGFPNAEWFYCESTIKTQIIYSNRIIFDLKLLFFTLSGSLKTSVRWVTCCPKRFSANFQPA
ncbi:MAG: hypothetical protein IIU35_06105 [Neisseriaceae bacterium]|nr:hypothetical protein [Neisseriaceae bacterium]